ncbi:hypothetical protein Cgig2_020019 [Carnegiea gigantea]|uniref:Endonuclease/exonuclease/phosphatase n=1 Tax=Carnegiea gigantea TaxID=171969 RepID=A0A9Q1KCI2_9CARY|nr:hypothetical protein Cgig2_020019 [Carnegiea gigantea]
MTGSPLAPITSCSLAPLSPAPAPSQTSHGMFKQPYSGDVLDFAPPDIRLRESRSQPDPGIGPDVGSHIQNTDAIMADAREDEGRDCSLDDLTKGNFYPNIIRNISPLSYLVWNDQGAGKPEFKVTLKEFIRMNRPSIGALLETYLDGSHALRLATNIGLLGHMCIDTVGFSGGIWLYYNKGKIEVRCIKSHAQQLTVKITRPGEKHWFFTAIYANPDCSKSDFNETTSLERRHRGSMDMSRRCDKFKFSIANNALIDLGFSGPKFTWNRGKTMETRKSARLDRGLCNTLWRVRFPKAVVRHLPALNSDHNPLLINTTGFAYISRNERPFRFLSAWQRHPNALRSRFLRSKYCNGRCDLDMFLHKPGASNCAPFIRQEVRTSLGNRKNTFFWDHTWATDVPLITLAVKDIPIHMQDTTVEEFWIPNRGWDWERFVEYLPGDALRLIEAHSIIQGNECMDRLYWNGTPGGVFTVKSAMKIIRLQGKTHQDKAWHIA